MTRFKQNFEPYIELMFEQMMDYTEPICQMINSELAGILTFDTSGIELYVNFHFSKALIPYNPRNESSLKKVGYNEYGYPSCPEDSTLSMKYHGITKEKGRADRIK